MEFCIYPFVLTVMVLLSMCRLSGIVILISENFGLLGEEVIMVLMCFCVYVDCYDPLDPNGNITVTFDVIQRSYEGYTVSIYIYTYVAKCIYNCIFWLPRKHN